VFAKSLLHKIINMLLKKLDINLDYLLQLLIQISIINDQFSMINPLVETLKIIFSFIKPHLNF